MPDDHKCDQIERLKYIEREVKKQSMTLYGNGRTGGAMEELTKLRMQMKIFTWVGCLLCAAVVAQVVSHFMTVH